MQLAARVTVVPLAAVLTAVLAPGAALAARAPEAATATVRRTVVVEDFAFKPGTLTVSRGGATRVTLVVTLVNRDTDPHNYVIKKRARELGRTATITAKGSRAARAAKTFTLAGGRYQVLCTIHGFGGKLTVA